MCCLSSLLLTVPFLVWDLFKTDSNLHLIKSPYLVLVSTHSLDFKIIRFFWNAVSIELRHFCRMHFLHTCKVQGRQKGIIKNQWKSVVMIFESSIHQMMYDVLQKTCSIVCLASKAPFQPVQPHSLIRVFAACIPVIHIGPWLSIELTWMVSSTQQMHSQIYNFVGWRTTKTDFLLMQLRCRTF